jgi:secondary thiamine-phosphate synthase enzyme
MIRSHTIALESRGRGTFELTDQVQRIVRDSGISQGLCTVFVHHTSASLIINENADASVQRDLEAFMKRLVPDGDPLFQHTAEGPDDMPSHVRCALTQTSISIPVASGVCDLGTWQGIYLWEHRRAPHRRRITVTVLGE